MFKDAQESGLTMVELLASTLLALILLAGVYTLFSNQTRAYSLHDRVMEMQDNGRFALETMVRDIQMAGYDPPDSKIFGITDYKANDFPPNDDNGLVLTTNTELYFTVNADEIAGIANNGNERFGFRINSGDLESAVISAVDGSRASWEVIAEEIESMTFFYTYADGNNSTVVGLPHNAMAGRNFRDIRTVTLSLTAMTSREDPHYTHPTAGDGFRRITLTEEIFPRNLGF